MESESVSAQIIFADVLLRRPTWTLAELRQASGKDKWIYRLDWASPRIAPRGAPHSTGVSLFFRNNDLVAFARGLPPAQQVADDMSGALASLMAYGDPSKGSRPEWTRYTSERRAVLAFDYPSRLVVDPDGPVREILDSLAPEFLL